MDIGQTMKYFILTLAVAFTSACELFHNEQIKPHLVTGLNTFCGNELLQSKVGECSGKCPQNLRDLLNSCWGKVTGVDSCSTSEGITGMCSEEQSRFEKFETFVDCVKAKLVENFHFAEIVEIVKGKIQNKLEGMGEDGYNMSWSPESQGECFTDEERRQCFQNMEWGPREIEKWEQYKVCLIGSFLEYPEEFECEK